jgi:2-phospho-L-lactate guanylyltransferase
VNASAAPPGVIAIVPVGAIDGAKSRLGRTLDAEERRDLVIRLARRAIEAAVASGAAETLVITPDDEVRQLALEAGARPIRQRTQGLNQALAEARDEAIAAGAGAIVVLPIDLPLVSPEALGAVLAELRVPDRPLVALVPDRHRRGTNTLLVAPADAIDFCFGGDSRSAHAAAAALAGARYVELEGPLTLDVDTPDDLLLLEELAPEVIGAG